MIRINLLGEKTDYSVSYLLQLLSGILVIVLGIGACFLVQDHARQKVENLRSEKSMLEQRLATLTKKTKQVEELEQKRKYLKEKLMTIASLKAKKHGPVHILDDLNTALPERAWVLELKEKSGTLEVNGVALDNQTIAGFMKSLETYKYFGNVDLVESTEYVKDEVKLKQYTINIALKAPITLKEKSASETAAGTPADAAAAAAAAAAEAAAPKAAGKTKS